MSCIWGDGAQTTPQTFMGMFEDALANRGRATSQSMVLAVETMIGGLIYSPSESDADVQAFGELEVEVMCAIDEALTRRDQLNPTPSPQLAPAPTQPMEWWRRLPQPQFNPRLRIPEVPVPKL
jgi:hypothetical protein